MSTIVEDSARRGGSARCPHWPSSYNPLDRSRSQRTPQMDPSPGTRVVISQEMDSTLGKVLGQMIQFAHTSGGNPSPSNLEAASYLMLLPVLIRSFPPKWVQDSSEEFSRNVREIFEAFNFIPTHGMLVAEFVVRLRVKSSRGRGLLPSKAVIRPAAGAWHAGSAPARDA